MDKILDLLAEISRKLDRLGNVHANTISNWAREFSGLHVGKNQYSVAKLREIIALKKAV